MTDNCQKGEPPDVENCSMRSFSKNETLDGFHYHEFSDRVHLICSMIDDHLYGHHVSTERTRHYLRQAQRCLTAASDIVDNEAEAIFHS